MYVASVIRLDRPPLSKMLVVVVPQNEVRHGETEEHVAVGEEATDDPFPGLKGQLGDLIVGWVGFFGRDGEYNTSNLTVNPKAREREREREKRTCSFA